MSVYERYITCGSGNVYSADDVLDMSAVSWVKGVCVWLGTGWEVMWVRGLVT